MHSNLVAWLERLENTALPALPVSAGELARLVRDDNIPMPALASVVEKDPGLTVALLRRINSLKKKHLGTEVTTASHALMLLGLAQVRAIAESVPVIDKAVPDEPQRDGLLALYARAIHAGVQARDLARLRKDLEPDEMQTAAQLHDLSEMLMRLHAPEEMARMDTLRAEGQERERAEFLALGFGLNELTAELAPRWGLPTLLHDCALPENAGHARVIGIVLAVQIARAAEHGWYTAEMTRIIEQVAAYLHVEFGEAAARVHGNAVEAARLSPCARTTPAAATLLFPSQPEAMPGVQPEGDAGICVTPQAELVRRTLHGLIKGEARDIKAIVQLALEGMREGAGLDRVVFATPSTGQHLLKARYLLGPEGDPLFNRFAIQLDDRNLFAQLLRKPQALWLSDVNREKFWPLVPQDFRDQVQAKSFFALSVFVGDTPVGLFYADRQHNTCGLDATAYNHFKQIGLAAAKALEEKSRK